jgi:phage FluMu gp28-like protein
MGSLDTLNNNLSFHQRVLELVDPVTWLRANTSFDPWPYEAELLSDSHLRTRVVRKSRQVGITTTIAHEAVWKAFTTNKRVILIVSPSQRQSGIVMGKIRAIVNANTRLSTLVARSSNTELHLRNGSMIAATPNNPDRIRGYTANDIYLDEAAHFLNDEPVMRAIKPMLIATQGTFTVISTPFGKRGLYWEQYKLAVDKKADDREIKAYEFHPSTISPLITSEDLERERQNLTELEFKQEYEGEFIEEADVYLTTDLIGKCIDYELELSDRGDPKKCYIAGIDFAKKHDETVVVLLELEDEVLIVRHISAWSHMDYSNQIGRIAELSGNFRIIGGAADQTGVGEAIIEDLQRAVPAIKGFRFTQQTKIELAYILRTALEQERLHLPNNRKLILQLNALHYTMSKAGNLLFESPEGQHTHDDYLWALALAVHAARTTDRSRPIVRSAHR